MAFGKMNAEKMKSRKKDYEKRGFSGARKVVRFEPDAVSYFRLLPPHESMDGVPWTDVMLHYGLKEYEMTRCQREERKDPRKKCVACRKGDKIYKQASELDEDNASDKKRKKALEEQAKGYMGREHHLFNAIDVTGIHDGDKHVDVDLIPECYGDKEAYDEEKKACKRCPMSKSCAVGGVQILDAGQTIFDCVMEEVESENEALFSLKNGVDLRVKRKGKGQFDTKYIPKVLTKPWSLPKHVRKVVEEGLIDIDGFYPRVDTDEMKAIVREFEAGGSDDDDDDDDKAKTKTKKRRDNDDDIDDKKLSKKGKKSKVDDDDDEYDEDEVYRSIEEDEEEEDEEDDDMKKLKKDMKKAAKRRVEDDDDDDDEEEDKPSKKKGKKEVKKGKRPAFDDDDDEDDDD